MKLSTTTSLSILALLSTAACGGGVVEDFYEQEEAAVEEAHGADEALFADTSLLHKAPWDSSITPVNMCWKSSAFKTDGNKSRYDAARAEVEQAISDTWDANSWARIRWSNSCSDGDIPVNVGELHPNASPREMNLNFEFKTFSSGRCQAGTVSEAAWKECLRSVAVHEMGHVLGFDHEQNRGNPSGIECDPNDVVHEDVGNFYINGDLGIGAIDKDSVMSYCGWRDTLSSGDRDAVRKLYGGPGMDVRSGNYYGIRLGNDFFDLTSSGSLIYTSRLDRAFRVLREDGSGTLRYGDKIRIQHGNQRLCSTLGTGTQWGTVPPTLKWTTRPYHPDACVWTVEHVTGSVGGSTVDVNDPIKLRLQAPGGTSSNQHADIPYNSSINVRLLGDFPPL